ncbi:MAG: ATP-binding cassette domain-containing protein, partial [Verrucomicrobia bacterium]|nr:ATP-binding cassette domain-containing protein [Cytophagales bacterium]
TQELEQESISKYLDMYREKSDVNEEEKAESKLTSVKDSVKTLALCKKINATLEQQQKVIVLIRLLELVNADRNFTNQRMSLIETVANVFRIPHDEYLQLRNLIIGTSEERMQIPDLLVVNGQPLYQHPEIKHHFVENLAGEILFIHIKSVDMYFFRKFSPDPATLGGQNIIDEQVYSFPPGSIVRAKSSIYYSDIVGEFISSITTTPISFHVRDLEFRFTNGAIGLRNINLMSGPGRLIGIMGGSGAGKTTLLNVLAGIEKPSRGEVLINGINIYTQAEKLEGVIGYIAQDDILLEDLTVYENLYYNAKLCFKSLSEEQTEQRVMDVLISLGLDHIRDLKVGNVLNKKISGGQRKRLNIALELIREPAVMFVDEPTSGLSSRDSENVIDLLKELSLKGKLIFVVIHQPSSEIYKMFDKMFILDTGGYPVYFGNPVDAVTYFKRQNNQIDRIGGQCPTCGNVTPELIFNIVEAKVVDEFGQFTNKRKVLPAEWHDKFLKFKTKIEEVETINEAPPKALDLPSRFRQMLLFTKRDLLSKLSNTQYLVINLLEAPLLALLLAFIIRFQNDPRGGYTFRYNDNIPAYILVGVLVAIFMGLTVSAEEIIKDRKIQKRESFLNLSRTSYLFSKIIILFILSAIQTITFVIIGNSILEVQGMTFSYWLVLFSLSCFANMLGLNISSSFNSVITIYITIPLLIIPQMILSGLIFNFDKLNGAIGNRGTVPIIADIIASRWGMEAIAVQQYTENTYEAPLYPYEKEASKAYYKSSYLIPLLQEKLEYAANYYNSKNDSLKLEVPKSLEVVREDLMKELRIELKSKPVLLMDIEKDLQTQNITEQSIQKTRDYLSKLKDFYIQRFNQAEDAKEREVAKLQKANPTYDLTTYKDKYFNEALADLVKNSNAKQKIVEYKNKLVQQVDPVYFEPTPDNLFDYRSHFFAPTKHFLGVYMHTFVFNTLVIWFMCIVLYFTLYFETFRKIVEGTGKIKFTFAQKIIDAARTRIEARREAAQKGKTAVTT